MKSQSLFLALLLCFVCGSAHAATFTVSKLADTDDGVCDADCSLREAITAANSAAGDDVISFAANVRGAITLNSELPVLQTNIDIQGPGARLLTVQRNTAPDTPDFRILHTWLSNISLSGLTCSNGRTADPNGETTGGAMETNSGVVTIRSCVFANNYSNNGGAILNYQST